MSRFHYYGRGKPQGIKTRRGDYYMAHPEEGMAVMPHGGGEVVGHVTRCWGTRVEVTHLNGKKSVWGVNRFWREFAKWKAEACAATDGLDIFDLISP